jgi:DNA-binding transcriptional regulator YdaS (Cro superfamily)
MTLIEYFSTEPRGAKAEMAEYLDITPTYISLLIHGKRRASPHMAISIEKATQGLVTRRDLRPDLYIVLDKVAQESEAV